MGTSGMPINTVINLLNNLMASNTGSSEVRNLDSGSSDFAEILRNLQQMTKTSEYSSDDLPPSWKVLVQWVREMVGSQENYSNGQKNSATGEDSLNAFADMQTTLSQFLLAMMASNPLSAEWATELRSGLTGTKDSPTLVSGTTPPSCKEVSLSACGCLPGSAWVPVPQGESATLTTSLEPIPNLPAVSGKLELEPSGKDLSSPPMEGNGTGSQDETIQKNSPPLLPSSFSRAAEGMERFLASHPSAQIFTGRQIQEKEPAENIPLRSPSPSGLLAASMTSTSVEGRLEMERLLQSVETEVVVPPSTKEPAAKSTEGKNKSTSPFVRNKPEKETMHANSFGLRVESLGGRQGDSSLLPSLRMDTEKGISNPIGSANPANSSPVVAPATSMPASGESQEKEQTSIPFLKLVDFSKSNRLFHFNLNNESLGADSTLGKIQEPPIAQLQKVVESIRLVHAGGLQELTLQLKPDYLGKIQIRAGMENQQVIATILVESPQVEQRLKENMNYLRESLGDLGFRIQRVEVIAVSPSSESQLLDWSNSEEGADPNTPQGKNRPPLESSFSMETEEADAAPMHPTVSDRPTINGRIDLRF